MSGILGIVNLDGSPVDRSLLTSVTATMAFRGPDGVSIWSEGPVGIGHARFQTLADDRQGAEPATLDGLVRISSHARLDDRGALRSALESRGQRVSKSVTDAQLILYAYRAWGEDCVQHLIGDFVFVIWDGARRRMFCARDHLGMRPFFYATGKGCIVVGNTMLALRQHPDVPDALDDVGMSDLLLFNMPQEAPLTAFAAIKRLPAAHTLTIEGGKVRTARYWELTEPREIKYRRHSEYLEHFNELFENAVAERIPPGRFTVLMSGGLDSTSIAASATASLRKAGRSPSDVQAVTAVFDSLVADEERPFATEAAEAIGIAQRFVPGDDCRVFDRWEDPALHSSEPVANPFAASRAAYFKTAASFGRVAMYGTGADETISELVTEHFTALWRRRRYAQLGAEMLDYVRYHRGLPPVGVRTALRRWTKRGGVVQRRREVPTLPSWLNPALTKRARLDERWRQHWTNTRDRAQFLRPRAALTLTSLNWSHSIEDVDAGVTRVPLEFQYPLADRRLMEYALAIPAVPWCVDKTLLRMAMKGRLPERVRLRPKTPFRSNPLAEMLRRPGAEWVDRVPRSHDLGAFVLADKLPRVTGAQAAGVVGPFGSDIVWTTVSPVYFNFWLNQESLNSVKGVQSHV